MTPTWLVLTNYRKRREGERERERERARAVRGGGGSRQNSEDGDLHWNTTQLHCSRFQQKHASVSGYVCTARAYVSHWNAETTTAAGKKFIYDENEPNA